MRPAPLITISSTVKRAVGSTVRWSGWTWSSSPKTWWKNMSFSGDVFDPTKNTRKLNLKRRHFRDSLPWRYIKVALMKLCFLDHFVVSRTLLRMCYMQVLSKQRPSWQRPQFAVPATKRAKREKNSRSTCVLAVLGLSGGQTFQLDCAFKSLRHLSHFVVDHTPPL